MKPKAILPLLMLCATACALALSLGACRSPASQPSVMPVAEAPLANAFRMRLPAGTQLILPTKADADAVRAIAFNEVDPEQGSARIVVLARPLQLVSPSYIAQRNQSEIALMALVEELKIENARLRAK